MQIPSNAYADFWLSATHAYPVKPSDEVEYWVSGEDALTPWQAGDGTFLMVYTSTRNELTQLHNASTGGNDSMGAQFLVGWPWKCLIGDGTCPPVHSTMRLPYTFPDCACRS